MKKYLSRGLGFLVLGSLLFGATPVLAAGENPTTNPVGVVTTTDATLNGTNGSFAADAGTEAFWYGTTDQSMNTFDPNVLPSGWTGGIYADTFNPTQDAPGDMFSKTVTGLTPNTQYYYVAWVSVGSVWYPGAQESFMTTAPADVTPPAVPTHLSPADDSTQTTATQTLIDWSDEVDPSSPVVYFYQVSNSNAVAGLDNAFVTPLATISTSTDSFIATPNTPDGVYYWHVRAVDNVGNASAWSTPWKITVDNTCTTDFDLSTLGSVNGKEGWSVTNPSFDQSIVLNTFGFPTFGCKTFRISNAFTSGSFGDQTFSPSNANEAGESATDNHFESQFDIASTSQSEQAGLKMSVSPDRGDGSRMSYLRFEDQADGIHVFFDDVQGTVPMGVDGCLTVVCGNFVETGIATLDRLVPHTIKFSMDFLDGAANDIVKIYIDGNLKITGTSWEDYYRFDPEQAGNSNVVPAVDSLIFRASGAAVLGNANNGFIFDNFGSDSEIKDPTPTTDASLNAGTNSVTLHGTNGEIDSDAGDSQGFWYGQTDEGSFTSGTNPAFPGGTWVGGLVGPMNHAAGGDFTYDLAGLAPSTTYYYVAWTEVGGIWYPGEIESFTTDNNPQTINGSVSTQTYGVAPFDLGYTATSGLPVTYTQTSPTICTITGNTITVLSVGSCTFDVDQSGGGTYDPAPTVHASFTVAPKNLTVTGITGSDKVYDGNTSASFTGTPTLVGVVGMDNVTVSGGTATFSNKNVGPRTLNFTGMTLGGLQAGNYTLTQPTLSANITARPITVTAVTDTKVYNGNNSASSGLVRAQITSGSLATPLEALLNIGRWAQTYNNENVGTNKVIAPTPATVIDGNSGNNYTVVYVNNSTGVITPRTLNVTPVGENKVYDATTNASVTFTDNRVSGDDLTIVGTAQFPNKAVGTGKVVSVLTVNSTGPDAGNYTINLTTGVTLANITTATLTATVDAQNKVYDTTDTATATCAVTPLLTDSVGCSVGASTFSNEDAGLGKTVTATGMSLTGPDAGNYVLSSSTGTDTADITAAPVTVSFTASDKTYDGNNSATILTRTVSGAILPDVVTATDGTATFASVNAGTHTVTATGFTLNDTNYTVTSVTETTATINPATLTPSVSVPESKVYDGTTNSSATCSVSPIEGDDVACVVGGASYDDKNVGGEKTVTVTGMTLSGEDAGNYVLSSTTGTAGSSITPLSLTVFASAQNKQVDGNTTATVTLSNNAFVGDTVTQTYTTANFADALVGVAKVVTVEGIVIDGLDAGNYTLDSNTATTTADITSTPSSGSSGSRVRSRTVVGNTGTVLGAEKFNFTQNMRQGAVGNEVMELQKFLNANGFGPLVVDGKFGPITRAAVVKFQLANGLVGDGVVGPLTRAVLNK